MTWGNFYIFIHRKTYDMNIPHPINTYIYIHIVYTPQIDAKVTPYILYIYMYICICMCKYIYIYIYIYIFKYRYKCTYFDGDLLLHLYLGIAIYIYIYAISGHLWRPQAMHSPDQIW